MLSLARTRWAAFAALSVVVTSLVVLGSSQQESAAADLSTFRPGNIIADNVFWNPGTMSEAQIQQFLEAKVPKCAAGATPACLRDSGHVVPNQPADRYCAGYVSPGPERSSTIIYRVAQSCGINPQVLLVTLQKEQGLVTSINPGFTRYDYAMGFGCPDTTGCTQAYRGFGTQVYTAAHRFNEYARSGNFTRYAPGGVRQVLFHPNAACGSSGVFIENLATAGLYTYTPYQPNRAALAAGYGTGDSCSTYGNRNFYQYFTDWFGSTQSPVGSLIQVAGRPEVYLVSGTKKHHVGSYEDLLVLSSRLGAVATVDQRFGDQYATSGRLASRYVHDPRTGTLYLLQSDGTKHRFLDAAQIERFGYPFDAYVDLSGAQADAFATGPEVGDFFRVENGAEVYLAEGGARRYVTTPAAYRNVEAGRNAYVASMAAGPAGRIPQGPAVVLPHSLVREASSGRVMMTLGNSGLLYLPSFDLAADLGATTYAVVGDGVLARNPVTPGSLTPIVSCGATSLAAHGGRGLPLTSSDTGGLAATVLPAGACEALPRDNATTSAPLFVGVSGRPEAYVIQAGQLHHVRTAAQLDALNGSRPLTLIRWSPGTAGLVGVGGPYLAPRSFVQFENRSEVYVGEGRSIRHVETYEALVRLGGGRVPPIERLAGPFFGYYSVGAPVS